MTIRPATREDIASVQQMYAHSRSVMRQMGDTEQWTNGYPKLEHIEADLRGGWLHIIESDPNPSAGGALPAPVGCFTLIIPPSSSSPTSELEPTYSTIYRGRWIDTQHPYAVLHRLAAAPRQKGIAEATFFYAKQRCPYLRADTHRTNLAMLHILERQGFVHSGMVFMADGTEREAYEWWRWDAVPTALQEYVESTVLPRYAQFDPARYGLSPKVVYTAAIMHDIGLCCGREEHHLASGRIIRSDRVLLQWLTPSEVEQAAQAAEDHRASATAPPRSLLGMVVAEADRDVEPLSVLRRTVEYGRSHYPHLSIAEQCQRALQHLKEKYSPTGYLRLLLPDGPNAKPLAELHALIADEAQLRKLLEEMIVSST